MNLNQGMLKGIFQIFIWDSHMSKSDIETNAVVFKKKMKCKSPMRLFTMGIKIASIDD